MILLFNWYKDFMAWGTCRMRIIRTINDWKMLCEQYKSSKLTIKEFCRRDGINYKTFRNRISEFKKADGIITNARIEAEKIIELAEKQANGIKRSAEVEIIKNLNHYAKKIDKARKKFVDSVTDIRGTLANACQETESSPINESQREQLVEVFRECLSELRTLQSKVIDKDTGFLLEFGLELKNFIKEVYKNPNNRQLPEYSKYIEDELNKMLKKFDMYEFAPKPGDDFNPREHKTKIRESGYKGKIISSIVEPGYKNEKNVLKHAIVTTETTGKSN
jgi:vacuolar-type H+-ATPase subunit H